MLKLTPAFASSLNSSVPVSPSEGASKVPAQLSAMLPSGIRGRGLGRGVPASPPPTVSQGNHHETPPPVHSQTESLSGSPLPVEFLDYIEAMGQNILSLREQVTEIKGEISTISHRGSDSQHVFDALHAELNDYKRDFIYEHMKPLLRPLLFIYDSIESFDKEIERYEVDQLTQNLSPDALRATKVRQNINFLREQLVEALQVCEVEPMSYPIGTFDPKTQKAIETVPVDFTQDGQVMNVIRIGWTMRGHILRPAEVIIGKANRNLGGHN
jgi:molecular chaperone GrpE (heat shock protein)